MKNLFIIGNLVVDRPAAQRMIMHSIPKHQIVPDPNARETTPQSARTSTSQKRLVEEISSESSRGEGERRPSKKFKNQKA